MLFRSDCAFGLSLDPTTEKTRFYLNLPLGSFAIHLIAVAVELEIERLNKLPLIKRQLELIVMREFCEQESTKEYPNALLGPMKIADTSAPGSSAMRSAFVFFVRSIVCLQLISGYEIILRRDLTRKANS